MSEIRSKPNDQRGFVHRRILGGLRGFVEGGFSPTAAAAGFLRGGDRAVTTLPVRRPPPRTSVARPSIRSAESKTFGKEMKFRSPGGPGMRRGLTSESRGCLPGLKRDPVSDRCVPFFLGDRPGPDTAPLQIGPGTPVGDAVMGRYGAGLVPGSRIIDRAVCLRGMVLGDDGICYNRKQIRNSDREWPRGRRPLLTGGDMRAISIASRAASRLTRTAVRLHEIGLIKKPIARKPPKKKC